LGKEGIKVAVRVQPPYPGQRLAAHPLDRDEHSATADSRIDLSQKGETVYRDKGYFGAKPRVSMDKTMHRAVRGWPFSIKENRRNKAISRTRSLVERPFAMMKRVFRASHLMVTTVAKVRVKNTFSCINFDLRQLLTLQRRPA